ncbi:MAG: inovirus Gp2 family protein [Cellvibrionaceae bacterium]
MNTTLNHHMLIQSRQYQGYPLMGNVVSVTQYTFSQKMLDCFLKVLNLALDSHPRTFVVRIDLRFPVGQAVSEGSHVIRRFTQSFKNQVSHSREMARKKA